MNLEDAVAAQVGTTPPETIQELILDACKATKVTGLDKFVNLRVLTLNGCGLKSLDDFPTLPELRTLELSDNQLVDGCLEVLQDAALLNLSCLRLAGNRFSSLDSLEPLVRARHRRHRSFAAAHTQSAARLPRVRTRAHAMAIRRTIGLARRVARRRRKPPARVLSRCRAHPVAASSPCACSSQSSCVNLKELDLFNCAVTETDNYRDGVFEMLPSLKYLDGFDACVPRVFFLRPFCAVARAATLSLCLCACMRFLLSEHFLAAMRWAQARVRAAQERGERAPECPLTRFCVILSPRAATTTRSRMMTRRTTMRMATRIC